MTIQATETGQYTLRTYSSQPAVTFLTFNRCRRFKIAAVGASDGMTWDYHAFAALNTVCVRLENEPLSTINHDFIDELHHSEDYTTRQVSASRGASEHTSVL